nr:uncharacterized protein LOC107429364 isoform X2 [Ziziphus jujuba var. spinosa]
MEHFRTKRSKIANIFGARFLRNKVYFSFFSLCFYWGNFLVCLARKPRKLRNGTEKVSFEPVPNSFAVVKSSFASVITSTRTIYTRSHCRRSNLCLICSIFIWWMKLERYVLYQCFSLSSLFGKEFWGKILMGMNNVLAFGSAEVYYGWALEILLIQLVHKNLYYSLLNLKDYLKVPS